MVRDNKRGIVSLALALLLCGFASPALVSQETPVQENPSPEVSPRPSSAPQPTVRPVSSASPGDALQAYRQGNYQLAVDITFKEIAADPRNMDSYAVLGWSLNALKRYREAADYTQRGRQYNPADHRLVGILAEANYSQRNDLTAASFYQQYISMTSSIPGYDPRYTRDAYRDLAEIFIRFGEYHHADIALSSAVLYDTGRAPADLSRQARFLARQGFVREQLKDFANAKLSYDKSIERDPNNGDAIAGRARVNTALASSPTP